ncbi:unnamed protein product [Paramecium octaurelia]|uniref:Tetratricopeptide repeat protein n=1 Tax=Paramecium octaurelia TaxID=43137 RepID=A0A8S1YC73_PAROT|nr:unnamed protein product [Paramecium octaurelia]
MMRWETNIRLFQIIPRSQIWIQRIYRHIFKEEFYLGNWDKALIDFNKVVELVSHQPSNNASFFYNRGFFYQQMGNKNLALDDNRRAIELDPEDPQSYCNRGMIFKEIDEQDKPLIDYNKAIQLNLNKAAFYFHRSTLFIMIYIYRDFIQQNRKQIEPFTLQRKIQLKQYQILIRLLNWILKMNQHFHIEVINYYMEGLIYQKVVDKNQALQDYDEAIELNPKNQLPYYQRGVLQSEIGNNDQTLIDYNTSIALDPNNSNFYTKRGALLKELNVNDKAYQDYNKALELDSNNLFALANLGDLYYKRQNYTISFDQYYRVLNLLMDINLSKSNS